MDKAAKVKEEMEALVQKLNAACGTQRIKVHQQNKKKENISLRYSTGGGGTLYIKPAHGYYQIALGTLPLIDRMGTFMERLTGKKHDGYNQSQDQEPRWNNCNYAQVREAAYFFADIPWSQNDDETIDADLNEIERKQPTQREALRKARIGQGIYRKEILELWEGKCAVTGLTIQSALIASHAKPWKDSTDEERLDPCNGLPLTATFDKLFDNHLIAFDPKTGEMLISHRIGEADRAMLGIPANLRKLPNDQQAHYLRFHLDKFQLHNIR